MSSPSGARSPSTPDSNDDSQSPPPSAASRVFAIVELAEAILNELLPRDLLLSQRTCKSFRDTFQGSIKIKKRLHLLPSAGKVLSVPPLWPDSYLPMRLEYRMGAAGKVYPHVIILKVPCRDEAFVKWLSRNASWWNMQIGSPPVRTGRMLGGSVNGEWDLELAGITCERGLTLGDLVDAAGKLQQESSGVHSVYIRLGVSEVDEDLPPAPKQYVI